MREARRELCAKAYKARGEPCIKALTTFYFDFVDSCLIAHFLFSLSRNLVKKSRKRVSYSREINLCNMLVREIGYAQSESQLGNNPSTTPGH